MIEPHLFRINLCVQLCISDKVDNPSLSLLCRHVQLLCQHGDADALVDPAESLEDHHPGVLDKVVKTGHQEEVIDQDWWH